MTRKRALSEAGGLFGAAPPAASVPGAEGHRSRMRQTLIESGADSLHDYQLIEMILFIALPRRDTKPIAKALIARFEDFAGVLSASPTELRQVDGVGEAGIAALLTVKAAALRLGAARLKNERPVLSNSKDLATYLTAQMAREKVEQFRVLFLDIKNRLLADEVQARGTVNHTPVYIREVVKRALELQASALILVHNHPSGDATPSRADIEMTQQVKRAAALLDIAVHDHLIIGRGTPLSFRSEGLL